MQQALNGQSAMEVGEAIGAMTQTARDNGEFITRESLEAMYQNSEYL